MVDDNSKNSFKDMISGIAPLKRKSKTFNKFLMQKNLEPAHQVKQKINKLELDLLANKYDQSIKKENPEIQNNLPLFEDFEKVSPQSKLEYRDFGITIKQMRTLKAGKMPIKEMIDLHGNTKNEAQILVNNLLNNQKNCVVLIIHGKGYNSENKESTLKSWLNSYLKKCGQVKAFCSANAYDGGAGAVYVWIK